MTHGDDCPMLEPASFGTMGNKCTCKGREMTYESWRISFQSSEGAARSAYEQVKQLTEDRDQWMEDCRTYCDTLHKREDQIVILRAENDKLKAAVTVAAEQIRKCDYTSARSTLLEALK